MRIGVFGGTFDPVHESHIQMGLDALEQCHLDKVFFVPTRPWQKTARASEEDRAAMLSMALSPHQNKLIVDRRELERTGASYSIDTLYSFRQEFGPETPIYFIMGSDQWKNLKTWVLWEKFPLLCNLLIYTRDGEFSDDPYEGKFPIIPVQDLGSNPAPNGLIVLARSEPAPYSSTAIRTALFEEPSRSQTIPGLTADVHQFFSTACICREKAAKEFNSASLRRRFDRPTYSSVIKVISDGTPTRIVKPFHSPDPFVT